jgi:hypothetical protein
MPAEPDAMVRLTLKVWQVSVTLVLDYLLMLIVA